MLPVCNTDVRLITVYAERINGPHFQGFIIWKRKVVGICSIAVGFHLDLGAFLQLRLFDRRDRYYLLLKKHRVVIITSLPKM